MADLPLSWLMLATHLRPGVGGGGMARYARELAEALARRPDVELSLLVEPTSAVGLGQVLRFPPVGLLPAPSNRTVLNSIVERTGWGVPALRRGFDVVHGTKHLVPRRSAALTLLTVHDTILLDRPRDFPPLKRRLLGRPYIASLAGADHLVAVSKAAADQAIRHVPGVSGRTSIAPLAVSSSLLHAQPVPVPDVDGANAALVVSDSSPRKNLAFLLACWPEVRRRRPGAGLVIVGPRPPEGSAVAVALASAGARGGVVHLGPRTDGELRWLYESCRVTLCPSEVEGFGLPALEAVTFGCPVVTSTDPALAEAAGGRATAVATNDPRAWSAAVAAALAAPRPRPQAARAPRSWDDVADETVAAARLALARRNHGATSAKQQDRLEAL